MYILLTGNRGFVGRHLQAKLESDGHYVWGCNTEERNLCLPYNANEWPVHIDCIIHLAALAKAGDWHLTHKGDAFIYNQIMNTQILSIWKEWYRNAMFITMGTSCAYDPNLEKKPENYLEGTPDGSLYEYAMTKRMLLIGLRSLEKQFGMKSSYLVPNTMYGTNFDISDSHFIFDLIKKICDAKYTGSTATLWGDGYQKRELVFVDDVTNIISGLLRNPLYPDASRVINLAPGIEYSIREYAQMICDIIDYDSSLIEYNTNAFTGVRSKKLESSIAFQWTPATIGIARTINYYKGLKGYAL